MSEKPSGCGLGPGLSNGILALILLVCLAVLVGMLLAGGDGDQGYQPPQPEPWTGWRVIGLVALLLVGLLAVGLVLYALVRLALSLRAIWHEYQHRREMDALTVARTADQVETSKTRDILNATRVYPDGAHGRMGTLVRQTEQGWQVINLDAEAGAVLLGEGGGVDRLLADPLVLAQLQARHDLEKERARASAHPMLSNYSNRLQVTDGERGEASAVSVAWPERVMLRDLAPEPATLSGLVLGVTVSDGPSPGTGVGNAQIRPVVAALADLVHIAIGGSSGWGKSVFLRALALQLATAVEPCSLALIDLEGVTFAPFGHAARLLWPVADAEASGLAIMAALVKEMDRRKELYSAYPGVDSLAAYNHKVASNSEPLAPTVCLIDEATALLSDRSVHNAARTLALRGRKYGLWLVLGGQDWKAATIDTAIRNQLGTRVHFKAQSASQSRVLLGDGAAAAIETPGRAWAQLPGRPMIELQAPMVTLADIENALDGQEASFEPLPEVEPQPDADEATAARIRELAAQGLSLNAIQREVFGYTGGAAYTTVRQMLDDTTTTTGP